MGIKSGAYDYEVRDGSVYVRDPQKGDAVFKIVDRNTLLGESPGMAGIFKSKAGPEVTNNENNEMRQYFLEMLSLGKADGLEFGIGSNITDIFNKWGKPDSEGDFAGGAYCEYEGKVLLFYSRYSNSVTSMAFGEGQTLNGIKIGSSVNEIKSILGEPSDEYTAGEGNELAKSEKDWVISYQSDNYLAEFYANGKEGATYAAYLWEK